MVWRLFLVLALCAPSVCGDTITVSAAISLKDALTDIAKAYKDGGGDEVHFNFGASGTLETQIRGGAPVDVFISAADKQTKSLIKDGLAEEASRRVIAVNSLVLIVPADKDELKNVEGLANDSVKRIAVGDPKVVPAGDYAAQSLKALRLDAKLHDKLIYGASVRQVLAYVERGEVDAGIVYKTDAIAGGAKVRQVATFDEKTHDKIEYPAVLIKGSAKSAAAKKFLEYLATEKARTILKAKSFNAPSEDKR